MDKGQLRTFLVDSNKAGYASGDERKWIKEPDGSTTIQFEQGPWRSHDNFFGGEPYGGRTVVFYEDKPVWMIVYYGWVVEGVNTEQIYSVLRNALKVEPEEDYQPRGPRKYEEEQFVYMNQWEGDIESFSGEEKINQKDTLVYKANYMGGWVDRRKGVSRTIIF